MATKTTIEKTEATKRLEKVKGVSREMMLAGLGVIQDSSDRTSDRFKKLTDSGKKMEATLKAHGKKQSDKAKELIGYDKLKEQMDDVRERGEKLQSSFETRISSMLARFGVPSRKDMEELKAQLARLTAEKGETAPVRQSKAA